MAEDQNKEKRSKKLFKQHTELEILVSAAIVFAAVNSQEIVLNLTYDLLNSNFSDSSFTLGVVILLGLIAATIFPISIITHLVLRSYWLALVGLKLAFEDQEAKPLDFDARYKRKLNQYLNLDEQIRKMDKLTSSVFSFSFLILFSFLFSLIFFLTFIFLLNSVSGIVGEGLLANIIVITLMLVTALTSIMYVIDFFGLGVLKKIRKKWFHAIYYPIYTIYSIITFSRLYRGIYYTLITQVSRKVVISVLPLYVLVTVLLINAGYNSYLFYPPEYVSKNDLTRQMYLNTNYRDELTRRDYVERPVIQSRIIHENHIRLFIPLSLDLEDSLTKYCNAIVQFDSRGFHWKKNFTISGINSSNDSIDNQLVAKRILECMKEQIMVSVDDSLYREVDYRFSQLKMPARAGVETIFSVKSLETGNHIINVKSRLFGEVGHSIPFWKD